MKENEARNPKSKPCPEDFDYFDKFILCAYDAQEWYSSERNYVKQIFNKDMVLNQYQLNIIAEQQAHWDFYKKMRDDYWEAKRKYNESLSAPQPDNRKSFREIELGSSCCGCGSCKCGDWL